MTVHPTPLAVLLNAMYQKWAAGDQDGAVQLARLTAPYLHPRVPPAAPSADVRTLTDAELDRVCPADGRETRRHIHADPAD